MASQAQSWLASPRDRKVRLWQSRRTADATRMTLTYLTLGIGGIFVCIPFFWMLSTSLKNEGAVFLYPPQWIPQPLQPQNYAQALTVLPFALFFRNTLITTLVPLVGALFSCSIVAYSFARLRWPGRDIWFLVVLATLMLPEQVTMIPRFILFRNLGWINTFYPLIVPPFFAIGAFNVFLLRQFFMTVSTETDDAAKIDGAGVFGIYWRILLPLSKPALAAVAVFIFKAHWDDFLGPLIYLHSQGMFTLALGLRAFQGEYGTDWNLLMAASLVVMLPVLLLFFFLQRYFIQGIVFTGIK
ncbi:MAG: carbohydrate ABC transporter permease [Chloroflexi bacterium]|nr:carbohydrate ABC transporter permease [Chloroflexota bacterium]